VFLLVPFPLDCWIRKLFAPAH